MDNNKIREFLPHRYPFLLVDKIIEKGGTIYKNARVTKIHKNADNVLTGVTYEMNGQEYTM